MHGSGGSCPQVHGLLSFLLDVYGLFDPSGKTVWLSVDHHCLRQKKAKGQGDYSAHKSSIISR